MPSDRTTLASLNGWRPADRRALAEHWRTSAYAQRLAAMGWKEKTAIAGAIDVSPRSVHNWSTGWLPWQAGALIIATLGDPSRWPAEISDKLLAIRLELETQSTGS